MITNISISEVQWKQASLPIRMGGLGIRQVSQVAPSAFLASMNSTKELQRSILRFHDDLNDVNNSCALAFWTNLYNYPAPVGDAANIHRNWDAPAVDLSYKLVLEAQTNASDRARILAVSSPRSSDWL